jgi:hypothetical protein
MCDEKGGCAFATHPPTKLDLDVDVGNSLVDVFIR